MRRTEMVSRQIEREHLKRNVTREEFLLSLKVRIRTFQIESAEDSRFARSLELLNKTNQFNTTGRRWTHSDAVNSMSQEVSWFCFACEDTFTDYGIISVVLVSNERIEQMVLSCRVFGFDVERAILSALFSTGAIGPELRMGFTPTEKNHVALQMLKDIGFSEQAGSLAIDGARIEHPPPHITVVPVHSALNP
jgi:FkbH-like protein